MESMTDHACLQRSRWFHLNPSSWPSNPLQFPTSHPHRLQHPNYIKKSNTSTTTLPSNNPHHHNSLQFPHPPHHASMKATPSLTIRNPSLTKRGLVNEWSLVNDPWSLVNEKTPSLTIRGPSLTRKNFSLTIRGPSLTEIYLKVPRGVSSGSVGKLGWPTQQSPTRLDTSTTKNQNGKQMSRPLHFQNNTKQAKHGNLLGNQGCSRHDI